jgi:hypothetical protein
MNSRSNDTLRVGVACSDRRYAGALSAALESCFRDLHGGGGPRMTAPDACDVLVYAFLDSDASQPDFLERQSAAIRGDGAPTKVFLELTSAQTLGMQAQETAAKNKRIADLANLHGGYLVPLMSKFMRWDAERLLTSAGLPNRRGFQAIARTIAKFVDRLDVRREVGASAQTPLASAQIPSRGDADAILSSLSWNTGDLPRTIRPVASVRCALDLLDGFASFPSYPEWGRTPLASPVDWSIAGPNRSWQSYFLGLEFVGPSLSVWLAMLRGQPPRDASLLTEALESRGAKPDVLLERAGAVIADFLEANPADRPQAQRAWHEGTVCRRLKVLLSFLICCAKAKDRGARIDAPTVEAAFASVCASLQMLQSPTVYIAAGNHGVRQDSLLIAAAMLFARRPGMADVLRTGLDRLERRQLGSMLSEDGVWLENSFEYHRLVMSALGDLASDLRTAGAQGGEFLSSAVERMLGFVEAVVTRSGQAPLIGDTAPREALQAILNTRQLLASLRGRAAEERAAAGEFRRPRETYLFSKSGYFASHSCVALDDAGGSSVLFYANLGAPKHKQSDDLSLLFECDRTTVLVDGGTYNKEVSDDIRNAARFDPASHNCYRVNGKGYSLRASPGRPLAGVTAMWSGPGWAAAHGFNRAYDDGRIDRFVIHLKRHSALIVADKLASASFRTCEFEQFWHLAPEFRAEELGLEFALKFGSDRCGALSVAFDGQSGKPAVEIGAPDNPIAWLMTSDGRTVPTPYIRRAVRARRAWMVSFFQWSERWKGPARLALKPGARARLELESENVTAAFAVGENGVERIALSD